MNTIFLAICRVKPYTYVVDTCQTNTQRSLARLQQSAQAMVSWHTARQDLTNGRPTRSLGSYRELVQRFPDIAQLWLELAAAAAGDLDFDLAEKALQKAGNLAPYDANLLQAVGTQYYHLRNSGQALACFRKAAEAAPSSTAMRLALAAWLERYRRLDEALECVQQCLEREPNDGASLYFKAFLLHRQGLNPAAENILRDLLKNNHPVPRQVQCDAHHLLGAIMDAAGNYEEALQQTARARAMRSQMVDTAALDRSAAQCNQARRELLAALTPEIFRRWRDDATATPSCPYALGLLSGMMRSGTTLIEQILGANPEILAVDESMNSLQELLRPLQMSSPGGNLTLKTLDGLAARQRTLLASRYCKSLLRETPGEPGSKLVLDKNPSTTAWLHVWLRIFPLSKVIVALRDPRDVILSCYLQNFPKDWAIAAFGTLERTAKFYTECMDVWLRMRELGGFAWIESRYEDVVGNLEAEGRRVTNFLGRSWHERQANYHDSARGKFVHSPTYGEVAKPVYTRAVRRWENYASALAPLEPVLQPYLRAFGYA